MPIVRMTRTENGSITGITTKKFIKGRVYTISDDLANVFVNTLKCAEPMPVKKISFEEAEAAEKVLKEKAVEVPKNKAINNIPVNKNEYVNKELATAEEFTSKSQIRRLDIMKKGKNKTKKKGKDKK